jgi:beta-glucan synthesis-associated protein KRE6
VSAALSSLVRGPLAELPCRYIEAYTNPNLTTWVNDFGQTIPKNSLTDGC